MFGVVPGATISGRIDATRVTVRTPVSLAPDGETITYERRANPGADGAFAVRVAHPGEYAVGDDQVTVPDAAVWEGTTVEAGAVGGGSADADVDATPDADGHGSHVGTDD